MGSYNNPANRRGRTDHAEPMTAPTNDPFSEGYGAAEAIAEAKKLPEKIAATVTGQPYPQEPAKDRVGNF